MCLEFLLFKPPRGRTAMVDDAKKSRGWTPRRIVRSIGTISIVTSLVMALIGAYGLGASVSAKVFYIYWSVFFLFLFAAVMMATIDALVTMVKFRKEREDLKKMAGSAMRSGDISKH